MLCLSLASPALNTPMRATAPTMMAAKAASTAKDTLVQLAEAQKCAADHCHPFR